MRVDLDGPLASQYPDPATEVAIQTRGMRRYAQFFAPSVYGSIRIQPEQTVQAAKRPNNVTGIGQRVGERHIGRESTDNLKLVVGRFEPQDTRVGGSPQGAIGPLPNPVHGIGILGR